VPLYDFRCRSCARTFEALVRKDAPSCPHCQSTDLERLLSSFAVSSPERTQQAATKNRKQAAAVASRDNVQMDREIDAHRRDDH
jgi:putative FmdB family regulatory protein